MTSSVIPLQRRGGHDDVRRIHHPSCPGTRRTEDCVCPPIVGDVVTVAGLEGRWRVVRSETGRLELARAGRTAVLYGSEISKATVEL